MVERKRRSRRRSEREREGEFFIFTRVIQTLIDKHVFSFIKKEKKKKSVVGGGDGGGYSKSNYTCRHF